MKSSSREDQQQRPWSFVTNHARVFAFIADQPRARLRDIATAVGITERTTIQIVGDLERAGLLSKTRDGRRNHYAIDTTRLNLPRVKAVTASQLLLILFEALERQPFS